MSLNLSVLHFVSVYALTYGDINNLDCFYDVLFLPDNDIQIGGQAKSSEFNG